MRRDDTGLSRVRGTLAAACALALVWPTAAWGDPPSPELTIEEAVALALRGSPRLRVDEARVGEAEGRLVGADTYPFNPELELEGAARLGPEDTTVDWQVGLSQALELGGQGSERVTTARVEVDAARSGVASARRLVAAEVHLAFVDALEAREALAVAREEVALARQLLDFARRRLDAGAGTILDVNVASAEVGRAEQAVGALAGDYGAARAVLAEAVGLSADSLPAPVGALDVPERPLPAVAELIAGAEERRADLHALRDVERAARARIELARAEAWSSMRVGVFVGQEEATDTMVGASLSIPLPFFQRNQGGVAEATAAVVRVAAEQDVARLSVAREVVVAHERYQAGLVALASLRELVLGGGEENLELLRRSFEAGKIGWGDVLVMRRALFDARRALIATNAAVRRARVRLDIAAGLLPLPTGTDPEVRP